MTLDAEVTQSVTAIQGGVDLEILRHKLHAIAGEMGVLLSKSAQNTEIADERDYATCIADRHGGIVCLDNPLHLGALARTAASVLDYFKFDMKDGDVVLTSNPYQGGTHVQDLTLIRPYVIDNVIVLYLAARGHVPDFAGQVAGGYFPTAKEVWAEGAPLSPVKIHRYDRPVRDVLTTVLLNSRQPGSVRRALDALLGSLDLGRRRVAELIDRYGIQELQAGLAYSQDHTERRTRAAVAQWQDGATTGEAWLDHDGTGGDPVVVRVTATVSDGELVLDFSESDDQRASFVNSTISNTEGFALVPLLTVLGDDVWPNSGMLRPVTVRSADGKVTNPRFPSAVGWSTVHCGAEVAEATGRALRGPAGAPYGALTAPLSLVFCRPAVDRDTRVDLSPWCVGAASATRDSDGWGRPSALSRSVLPSVEQFESDYGIRIQGLEFSEDSGGAGRFRGAPAVEARVALPSDHVFTFCIEGRTHLAEQTGDGQPGSPARIVVENADGTAQEVSASLVESPVDGTVLVLRLGGGAGYDDPYARDPEAVLGDVLDDLVSIEAARTSYGVVVGPNSTVDLDATVAAREQGE